MRSQAGVWERGIIMETEIIKKIEDFLQTVFGESAKEIGGIIHDWAKYWRWNNLLKINEKIEKIREKRGIEGNTIAIPSGLAIEIIEVSSKEDNENIQQLWAGLITNATDSSKNTNIRKLFIRILGSLDPIDASILEWFGNQGFRNTYGKIKINDISKELQIDIKEVKLSLSNLSCLGLVDVGAPLKIGDTPGIDLGTTNKESTYRISNLGEILIEACKE